MRAAWQACTAQERRQLLVLNISAAVLNLGFGVAIPALPVLSEELGLRAAGVGLLLSAPGLARILFNLPAGDLADRVGRVPCMVVGTAIAAAGCLGTGLTASLATILPLRFFMGAGSAVAQAAAQAYIVDITQQAHLRKFRGMIIGAQGGLISAAYVIGPALGGMLTEVYGAQTAYCIIAGITAACAGLYAGLPETRPGCSALPGAGGKPGFSAETLLRAAREWRALLRDPNQQGLLAGNLLLFLNYATTVTIVPLHAYHAFGKSAGEIGALYSASSVLGVLSSPVAGRIADRHGRMPVVAPAVLTCAVGCLGVACSGQWEQFVAAYMLWSLGTATLAPVLSAYAADIAPKEQTATALALSRQAGDFVFFSAPLLLGLLFDACPGPAAMSSTAVLTLLGGAVFCGRAREAVSR